MKKTALITPIVALMISINAKAQKDSLITIPFTVSKSKMITVNATFNNVVTRLCIFDTGASGISLSASVYDQLVKASSIAPADELGAAYATIANGATVQAKRINLRSFALGDLKLSNVEAIIMPDPNAPLLIGQSAIAKYGKVSIDFPNRYITFEKTQSLTNPNISEWREIRFVPCNDSISTYLIPKIETYFKANFKANSFTKETNLPIPKRAVDRLSPGITIRYFDNKDSLRANEIFNKLLSNPINNNNVILENMVTSMFNQPIPNYIEIWVK